MLNETFSVIFKHRAFTLMQRGKKLKLLILTMMRQVPDKHLMRVRKIVQRIISHPRSSTSTRISSIGIIIPCVTTHTLPTWMVSIATCLLTRTTGMTRTATATTATLAAVWTATGRTSSTGAVTAERFARLVSRGSTLKTCRAVKEDRL